MFSACRNDSGVMTSVSGSVSVSDSQGSHEIFCKTKDLICGHFKTLKLEFQSNTEFQQANPNATLSFYSLSFILKHSPSKISGDKKGVLKCCKNSKIDVNLLNKKLVSGKMVIK